MCACRLVRCLHLLLHVGSTLTDIDERGATPAGNMERDACAASKGRLKAAGAPLSLCRLRFVSVSTPSLAVSSCICNHAVQMCSQGEQHMAELDILLNVVLARKNEIVSRRLVSSESAGRRTLSRAARIFVCKAVLADEDYASTRRGRGSRSLWRDETDAGRFRRPLKEGQGPQ